MRATAKVCQLIFCTKLLLGFAMLCVVISGPSLIEAEKQLEDAARYTSLVEWRLDLFETQDIVLLGALKQKFALQTIFTLRPNTQGGSWAIGEKARLAKLEELASLIPDYIDLEHTVSEVFIRRIKQKYPDIKIILSHHDFEQTPSNLAGQLLALQAKKADFYKIASKANSVLDTFAMLTLAKIAPSNCMLMTMGPTGPLSRILAPVVGRPITYVSSVGQITACELIQIFGFNVLTPATAIYGLIGDPVDQSVSHISHNEVLRGLRLKSVYVKIPVQAHELGDFLRMAQTVGIKGLSVTMPLKEHVMQYCDSISDDATQIGAVNTLAFSDGKIIGSNTDCVGALDALESHISVKDKQIVVLGAGGAARAIAWQAMQRGADVTVCNRNKARAEELASFLGCRAGGLDELGSSYSIIINASSVSSPIDPQYIIPGCVAMDIRTLPKETLFLQEAKARGCKLVYGYEMFIKQAALQFKTWFKDVEVAKVDRFLTDSVTKIV